jgi:hypothetical protein
MRRSPRLTHVKCLGVLGAIGCLFACYDEHSPESMMENAPPTCAEASASKGDGCWRAHDAHDPHDPQDAQDAAPRTPLPDSPSPTFPETTSPTDDWASADRCADHRVGPAGVQGKLTISFETVTIGGMYTPRNCGAVWIEDSRGFYVRTLELWARERPDSIVAWYQSVCKTDATITAPDVITSATLDQPTQHSATWDTKDFRGRVVPDGDYTLWFQVTENEIFPEGPVMKLDLRKSVDSYAVNAIAPSGFAHVRFSYIVSANTSDGTSFDGGN